MKAASTTLKLFLAISSVGILVNLSGCKEDEPEKENTPEIVTLVTLGFTPTQGGNTIYVTASDPDGEGVQDLIVDGPISLSPNTTYTLTMLLVNELASSSSDEYDITGEIAGEADEHMFFFSWTNNLFTDPAGNGNIDNRADDVNYEDTDTNNLPLGLETTWTTGSAGSGEFRIVLKHQPDLKSSTSSSTVGETDLDLIFDLIVD